MMEYLVPSFILHKIDDSIAHKCSDEKLLELGLLYGDILSFRQCFSDNQSQIFTIPVKSYKERADELNRKLKRTHTSRLNSCKKTVIYHQTKLPC